MTAASQFSLEEENFYKDIQDLVKKGSQNEKELSTFLQRYMDLLTRADIDDETFIINFTKAGLIIEASAKVYGTKVDRLWITLEQVLEALKVHGKTQNNKKKGNTEEDVEDGDGEVPADDGEPLKKLPNPKKRKKLGEGLTSPDDFLEIDNISGLLGKNVNETESNNEIKIKFHEEIPNLFIRNKTDRKRIDVCLIISTDDRDDSRLRDWIVSEENMLVKEKYIAQSLNEPEALSVVGWEGNNSCLENGMDSDSVCNDGNEILCNGNEYEGQKTDCLEVDGMPDDTNNNIDIVTGRQDEPCEEHMEDERCLSVENGDKDTEVLNRSQEVDVGKYPNVFLRRLEDCLVDVNEVFWNSTKFQDVIPSRKMRLKKTNKTPCRLCAKKEPHLKKGKRCHMFHKNSSLDSYFSPIVQPAVIDPPFGILPDEELYNAFKIETKLIEELGKVDRSRNIYEAYHQEDTGAGENFLGFDGFENYLMRRQIAVDDSELVEDNIVAELEDDVENPEVPEEGDIGLPLPTTQDSLGINEPLPAENYPGSPDPVLERSQLEYENIITEELRNQEAAKICFERNKELGMKIAKWHSSLSDKIELSRRRGALNVDLLAEKILKSFPQEKSIISFRELVEGQCRRDIPRYFFACLQLTNEGNIDILKSNSEPLAIDCMMIKQLSTSRVRHELDEYTNNTSPRKIDKSRSLSFSSNAPSKRKRNSHSSSSSDSDSDEAIPKKMCKSKKQSPQKVSRKRRLNSEI